MDDKTPNPSPGRRADDYTYAPLSPYDAAPPAPEPDRGPVDNLAPADASVGSPPAPPRFIPVPAGLPAPTWEWQGSAASAGTAPPPRGWYGTPEDTPSRPVIEVGQARESGGGSWRQSPIGRFLLRFWPLLLLGLTKLKWVAVIFKFKAFTTFGSLLVSLGAYALIWGWQFGAGFIALLFIHELGHAAVMRHQGIKTTPILFVPFMGAVIGMKEMPKNVYAEAQMALGGPILGSLGAVGCLILWQLTGAPIFVALAFTGFLLNLFNLIPVSPLDGGRAMAAISPWGWLVGLALMVLLFLRVQSLMLGFILLVGGMEVFNRWRSRGADRAYYEATARQRLTVSLVYFGLAALLVLAMVALQPELLGNTPRR